MAARLERWKGHEVLIEAMKQVADSRLHVWIAGPDQIIQHHFVGRMHMGVHTPPYAPS